LTPRDAAPRIERVGAAFRATPWTGPAPPGGWAEAFALYASDDPGAPPMLGRHAHAGDTIVFTPRFAPASGVRVRALFRPQAGAPVTVWFGGVPAPPRAPTTRVVSVTPSAAVWPENVLRLYVTFSAPMRIGVAWEHLRVLDATGRAMGGMFVEIDQELWDPGGQRLTVLFDPARIKRGLVDHINEGPPLKAGETCTLEIDALWRDAAGGLLAAPHRQSFAVGPPLRAGLDPAEWRLTPPASGRDPVVVDFPHPLDAALALRAFKVTRHSEDVECLAELEEGETRLRLTPAARWRPGAHLLEADPVLEDVAGNRIGRAFDIERKHGGDRAEARAARVSFRV